MYQAWPWPAAASPTAPGYAQPANSAQVSANQWPAGYNQYAAVTPEIQQQWAAAWASQAQYAYAESIPVPGQTPTTTAASSFSGTFPTALNNQASESSVDKSSEALKNTSEEKNQEEEEFERQFKDWEKQFDAWKEQNINHPDKEAFSQYEKQWQEWRAQLLQKKEEMQKAKALSAKGTQAITASVTSTNATNASSTTPAVDPSAGVYYQPSQYMYMQPYVYPGTGSAAQQQPAIPQQYPYTGGQPPTGGFLPQQMPAGAPGRMGSVPPPNMNAGDQDYDQYNYGPPEEKFPVQGENTDFGNSNQYPPDYQEQYQRGANFARGQPRGRGRGRGRWSDPNGVEGRNNDMRNQALLDPPNARDYPQEFHPPGPGNFSRGPRDGPSFREGPDNHPPPYEYPCEDFPDDYPPEEMPFSDDPTASRRNFPPYRDGPPPKFREGKQAPFHDGPPPRHEGKAPLLTLDGQPSLLEPPNDQPPHHMDAPSNTFEEPFPGAPFNERFPRRPHGDRFVDRDMDGYPPMEDPYGPPQFGEEFPPFDDRFPPNRGRFPPRGRRFPADHRDFDRFGPPGSREEEPFGPSDFNPPEERFPFSGDGPPRIPGRGRPPFGPGGRGRFPDEPFFREGGTRPPLHFNSIDYTHRPSEDFDPHYEFEGEFREDINQYRAVPTKRNKRPAPRNSPVEKKSRD